MKATRSQTIRFVIFCLGGLVFGAVMLYQVWRAVTEGVVFDVYLEDEPIEFYFAAIACALTGSVMIKFSADGLRLVLHDKHHERALQALQHLEKDGSTAIPWWVGLLIFVGFFALLLILRLSD